MFGSLRKILKSRPDEEVLALQRLTNEELQLISSFLWVTRLSRNVSPYRDAAFSLMTKIEELKGDKFMEHAAIDVDMVIDVTDGQGNVDRSVGYHFIEIDV